MSTRRGYGHPSRIGPWASMSATFCLPLCLWGHGPFVDASPFSPPGVYEVTHYQLPNGLKVVLKPRQGARSVSIRLVVDVGSHDFPCGTRDTAHLLEHLLFTGTPLYDENALETLMRGYGGNWNAGTGPESTTYEVDVFSGNARLALRLLHHSIIDATLSEEAVRLSRAVLHREANEDPGWLRQLTYSHGLGKTAGARAMEVIGFDCSTLETPDLISRAELLAARARHYVPTNMALVVVGDFDAPRMSREIAHTFGSLPRRSAPTRPPLQITFPDRTTRVEGTLGALVGDEASIVLGFDTGDLQGSDAYALELLKPLLSARLYSTLRVAHGLAYTPSARTFQTRGGSGLLLQSDAPLDRTEEVISRMQDVVRELAASPLSPEELEKWKKGLLLEWSRYPETNAQHADYYAASLEELEDDGQLVDMEAELEALSADALRDAVRRHLRLDRALIIIERPTLSERALFLWCLGALALGPIWGAARWYRRRDHHSPLKFPRKQ